MGKKYWSTTRPDSALLVMRPNPTAEVRLGKSVIRSNDGVHFENFKFKRAFGSSKR
jgi:hypothetical protein